MNVSAVHHITGPRFWHEIIQHADIADVRRSHVNKAGDTAPQIQYGMDLHGCFAALEGSPREQRQAQIDGGGVQGVNRLVQFQPQIFVGVELPGLADEDLSNLGVDAPVAFQVGVRQRVAGDVAAKAHMIEPWVYGAETNFDIAQTLPRGELGESETQELVETGKALDLVIPPVALDATAELNHGEQIHQLLENGPSDMHDPASYR